MFRQKTSLRDKVVIVTGSTMGIGKELVMQLLRLNAKVVITGRDELKIQKLKSELDAYKDRTLFFKGDVTSLEDMKTLMQVTINTFSRIDLLIANAGLSGFGSVEKMNFNIQKQIIDTNLYGTLIPIHAAIQYLKRSNGGILIISSVAGIIGLPDYSSYSLSKMALSAYAQSLSIESRKMNIYVGIAYVGFTKNDPEKRTYTPEGNLVSVPERISLFTSSQSRTAAKIIEQIQRQKFINYIDFTGKFVNVFNRFLPSFLMYILLFFYTIKKSN